MKITICTMLLIFGVVLIGLFLPAKVRSADGWSLNESWIEEKLVQRKEGLYRCFVSDGFYSGGISCTFLPGLELAK